MRAKLLLAGVCILGTTESRVASPHGEPPEPDLELHPSLEASLNEPQPCTKSPTYADGCPGLDGIVTTHRTSWYVPRPIGGGAALCSATPSPSATLKLARDGHASLTSLGPRETSSAPVAGIPYPPFSDPYVGHIPHGWTGYPGQPRQDRSQHHESEESPQVPHEANEGKEGRPEQQESQTSHENSQKESQVENESPGHHGTQMLPKETQEKPSSSGTQASQSKTQSLSSESEPQETQKSMFLDDCEALPMGAIPVPNPDTAYTFLDYEASADADNASDGGSPSQSEEPTATSPDNDTLTGAEQPEESSTSQYPAPSQPGNSRHRPSTRPNPFRPTPFRTRSEPSALPHPYLSHAPIVEELGKNLSDQHFVGPFVLNNALEVPQEPVAQYNTLLSVDIFLAENGFDFNVALCAETCNNRTIEEGKDAVWKMNPRPFMHESFPRCNMFVAMEAKYENPSEGPAAMICEQYTSVWDPILYAKHSDQPQNGPKVVTFSPILMYRRDDYTYPPICHDAKKCGQRFYEGGDCSGWGAGNCTTDGSTFDTTVRIAQYT